LLAFGNNNYDPVIAALPFTDLAHETNSQLYPWKTSSMKQQNTDYPIDKADMNAWLDERRAIVAEFKFENEVINN
jgi:hypothetical protein